MRIVDDDEDIQRPGLPTAWRAVHLSKREVRVGLGALWIARSVADRLEETEFELDEDALDVLVHAFTTCMRSFGDDPLCTHCSADTPTRAGDLCEACSSYTRKYGRLPNEDVLAKRAIRRWRQLGGQRDPDDFCTHCGDEPTHSGALCNRCNTYRWKMGSLPPQHVLDRRRERRERRERNSRGTS